MIEYPETNQFTNKLWLEALCGYHMYNVYARFCNSVYVYSICQTYQKTLIGRKVTTLN